jgi:AraC-like DNA-binding protein
VKGQTRRDVIELIRALVANTGLQRLILLLQILDRLSASRELVPICSAGFLPKLPDQDGERLRRACAFIQERLAEPLHRNEAAAIAHLSPAAFSRFFKARTGKTFQEFVTEMRIGRACRLLGERELNVTEIAFACGFTNVASFNRAFRREKRKNPSEFRRELPALN